MREAALASRLANSQSIRNWASQPQDPSRASQALAELETYRTKFIDKSYFAALVKTSEYFYNNAQNEFADRQKRYVLSRNKSKDAWFFEQIRLGLPIHLNVNIDPKIGVTKLWINVIVRDAGKPLALVGTGLDLTVFVRDSVESNVNGISSFYVDRYGAVQLNRPGFELTPRSWTNFKGFHEEVQN